MLFQQFSDLYRLFLMSLVSYLFVDASADPDYVVYPTFPPNYVIGAFNY